MQAAGVVHRMRVVDDDVGALAADRGGDVQGRRVADVVAVRLERRAQHRHPGALVAAVDQVQADFDGAGAPPQVDLVDLAQERHRLVDAELAGPRDERADVLGQAAAAETEAGATGTGGRSAGRIRSPAASCVTSAPVTSHTSAIALMNEILVARKEFAATLTSSAVAKSVTTTGAPRSITGANAARSCCSAHSDSTPNTSRSGRSVSSTANPSRRNSGFQASSTSADGARSRTSCAIRTAVPAGTVDLPTTSDVTREVRGERRERGLDVAHVGGVARLALRRADADEVHVGDLGEPRRSP